MFVISSVVHDKATVVACFEPHSIFRAAGFLWEEAERARLQDKLAIESFRVDIVSRSDKYGVIDASCAAILRKGSVKLADELEQVADRMCQYFEINGYKPATHLIY